MRDTLCPSLPSYSLAGVSRSVTLVVAYIMTVTGLGWQEALAAVKVARPCAGPNLGFQRQLQEFEATQADQVSPGNCSRTECRTYHCITECGEHTISTLQFVKFFTLSLNDFLLLQFREWLQMEYKDNPFSDEADIRDLLARASKVNGKEVGKRASTPPGGI